MLTIYNVILSKVDHLFWFYPYYSFCLFDNIIEGYSQKWKTKEPKLKKKYYQAKRKTTKRSREYYGNHFEGEKVKERNYVNNKNMPDEDRERKKNI